MSKVITFSTAFPVHHPKKGQLTFFVQKIWKSLWESKLPMFYNIEERGLSYDDFNDNLMTIVAKHHTIRAGKRWKSGDIASLRVWSGRPYSSKQLIIAPDMELTVKDIEIGADGSVRINHQMYSHFTLCNILAMNDGLSINDMIAWFNKLPFSGQILVWNDNNLPY